MAQRTRSNFKSTYTTVFADNTTGAIAPTNERDFMTDIADSFSNISDDSQILTAKVTVSSAEILAAYTTPKQLVAAPGANKIIAPIAVAIIYTFNSIAYATHTTIMLGYDSGTAGTLIPYMGVAGILTNGATLTYYGQISGSGSGAYTNKNFCFSVQTGNPTAGNSTVKVSLLYSILDVS